MSLLVLNKNVGLKAGLEWVKNGFYTFREQALQFILLGILATFSNFLPLWGAFISPIFIAHFARLSYKVNKGETLKFSETFKGFLENKLVVHLAFISFCLNSIIFFTQYFTEHKLLGSHYIMVGNLSINLLFIFLAPLFLLQMALWLSPVICLFHPEIDPFKAMGLSIKAGFYNIPTLLLYLLIVITFTIIAIIPLGLGLVVWMPILNIIPYYIYKDMFIISNSARY